MVRFRRLSLSEYSCTDILPVQNNEGSYLWLTPNSVFAVPAPTAGTFVVSGWILFHQLAERRDRIFGDFQIIDQSRIKEGFERCRKENIRLIFFSFVAGRLSLSLLDSRSLFFRIITRTADAGVKYFDTKAVWISIIFICKCNISKVIGKHSFSSASCVIPTNLCEFPQQPGEGLAEFTFRLILWSFDQQSKEESVLIPEARSMQLPPPSRTADIYLGMLPYRLWADADPVQ